MRSQRHAPIQGQYSRLWILRAARRTLRAEPSVPERLRSTLVRLILGPYGASLERDTCASRVVAGGVLCLPVCGSVQLATSLVPRDGSFSIMTFPHDPGSKVKEARHATMETSRENDAAHPGPVFALLCRLTLDNSLDIACSEKKLCPGRKSEGIPSDGGCTEPAAHLDPPRGIGRIIHATDFSRHLRELLR